MSKGSYAALTAGLLARKGEAVPAAEAFSVEGVVSAHPPRRTESKKGSKWTDIDPAAAKTEPKAVAAATKMPEVAEVASDSHANSVAKSQPKLPAKVKPADSPKRHHIIDPCTLISEHHAWDDPHKRAAVTLRLGETRYLCLKMATAKLRTTNQEFLTEALDYYLQSLAGDVMKDCLCLRKLIEEEVD